MNGSFLLEMLKTQKFRSKAHEQAVAALLIKKLERSRFSLVENGRSRAERLREEAKLAKRFDRKRELGWQAEDSM